MDEKIIEAIKNDKIYLVSDDSMRRMICVEGVWEVWGQRKKYDKTHLIEYDDFDRCLNALIGNSL